MSTQTKEEFEQEVIDLFLNTKISLRAIAHKYNRKSYDFIYAILAKHNIDKKRRHVANKFSENEIQKIIELYQMGNISCAKIGEQYDVSESTIVRTLKSNGIEIRRHWVNTFDENGMVLKDVDVLSIHVDPEIKTMLEKNQRQMIQNMLSVQMAEANFNRTKKEVEMKMQIASLQHSAALNDIHARMEEENKSRGLLAAKNRFDEEEAKARLEAERERDSIKSEIEASEFERHKVRENQRLEIRNREIEQATKEKQVYAETVAKIMNAVSPDLIAAMQSNSNAETLRSVAESMAPLAIARGESVADTVNTLMRGTTLENVFGKIVEHSEG